MKMKRVTSLIMATVLALSLSTIPAFAASGADSISDSQFLSLDADSVEDLLRPYWDKSVNGKGVEWSSDADVIRCESPYMRSWGGNPDMTATTIEAPTSLVAFGVYAFAGRNKITTVNFSELTNLRYIGSGAFSHTGLTSADLSNTKVVKIDENAFFDSKIVNFVAPSTLKSIAFQAFSNTNSNTIKSISLNEGLESIGSNAFGGCCTLGTVILPSTLTFISDDAFWNDRVNFKVTKGTYAEDWCKRNGCSYTYADGSNPSAPAPVSTPTPTTTPIPVQTPTLSTSANVDPNLNVTLPTLPNSHLITMFDDNPSAVELNPTTFSNYVSDNYNTVEGNSWARYTNVTIKTGGSVRCDFTQCSIKLFTDNPFDNELSEFFGVPSFDASIAITAEDKIAPYGITISNEIELGKIPDSYHGIYCRGYTWTFNTPGTYLIQVGNPSVRCHFYLLTVTGEKITTPTTPTTVEAIPTASKIYADGVQKSFDAYNINGNNYFKLRDIAFILSGTKAQFEVTWDSAKSAIDMKNGKAYTAVGGEMKLSDGIAKTAKITTSPIYLDGNLVEMKAYNINGNNYFMLRDVGKVIGFNVSWDSVHSSVVIDSTQVYSDAVSV